MLSNSFSLQSDHQNISQNHSLRSQIDYACYLLSTNNIHTDSQDALISTLTSILHKIHSNNTIDLPHLIPNLDRLAIMLLLILTTGLESIRNHHILSTAKGFLETVQGLALSEITNKGISEFLGKLDAYFSKIRMQEEHPQVYNDEEEKVSREQSLTIKDQISLDMIENYEKVFPDIEQRFQEDQIEEKKPPKDLWDLIPMKFSEQERQKYSVSILDLEGNFIIMDKSSKVMFELNLQKQKTINLFDLMIPFSRYYLEKTCGTTIFSVPGTPTKTFSYTIYSRSSFVKYARTIKTFLQKNQDERAQASAKQRFTAEEADFTHETNSLYYKYLQTLTSNARLVKLSKENMPLFLYWKEMKAIFVQNELFEDMFDEDEEISRPVILLITRKANHIQKFRYDLMENFDGKIIKMQKSILRRVKKRLARKDDETMEEENDEIGIIKSEYDEEI